MAGSSDGRGFVRRERDGRIILAPSTADGKVIDAAASRTGLDLQSLADHLRVSPALISSIRTGRRRMTAELAMKLFLMAAPVEPRR